MKNYIISLPGLNCVEGYNQLAGEPGGQFAAKDILQLPGKIAKGKVKSIPLDAGFHMATWDVVFTSVVSLYKEAATAHESNSNFTILYILTPESVIIKTIGRHQQFNKLQTNSALFLSDDVYVDFQVQSNLPVRIISFTITGQWFQRFKHADQSTGNSMEWNTPLISIEPCSHKTRTTINSLFSHSFRDEVNIAGLQLPAVLLVTEFIKTLFANNITNKAAGNNVYYDKVLEAEAILQDHLQKNLPKVGKIAQQVALSESTLKRHFKTIFGMNIYEYYLEKKMMLAKTMLLEKPLTVNEAAEILGYEKVSNFIDIFKKHHGYSPGRFKKELNYANM